MNKLVEFGRKAMFYVRVLSGYEERRIRSYRLQLNRRIQEAQERKLALRKLPEQTILSEVRRMVEEMQNLNKKLEETEAAIEDYFKPIDSEAEMMMDMQLKGEEMQMEEMAKVAQEEALQNEAQAEKMAAQAEIEKTTPEAEVVSENVNVNIRDKDEVLEAAK
ncbi:hypothetical protein ACHQM5_029830 [Ranunculus cassubicifolius]